jgi:hypothetical protein
MIDSVSRRELVLASASLPLGAATARHAEMSPPQQAGAALRSFQVATLADLIDVQVPSSADRVTTGGFWTHGIGAQTLVRQAEQPPYLLWPRLIRSRDGAVWRATDAPQTPVAFGEIADGNYHPLSDRFASLAAAKRVYPFATSLAQSIDWAAIQTLAFHARGAEGFIPPGIRVVTDPIRLPARAVLTGQSCDPGSLCFRAHGATGAFVPGRGLFESEDYWNFQNPNYWHWAMLCRIAVDGAGIADHGIALWCMGEHSLLEDVWVQNARTANIYIGGYGAVGTLRNCSVWKGGKYGVWMTSHPALRFPRGGPGVVGGQGSGGSYRINNLSGDYNPIHICADGSQIVQLDGLKSEMSPVVISIGGSGHLPGRQRWDIAGFRAEGGSHGRAFLRIEDGATPSIRLGPGATYNYRILLEDEALGTSHVVAAAQAGITSLTYSRDPGDATVIATDRLSFFGAPPSPKATLPPALGPDATQAERDRLLNAIHKLLTAYGLG